MPDNNQWHVYIVRCCDGTFYTGIAKNVDKRVAEHNTSNRGAKYTKSRRPVQLIYLAKADSRSDALKEEYRIRKLPVADKVQLARILHQSVTDRPQTEKKHGWHTQ